MLTLSPKQKWILRGACIAPLLVLAGWIAIAYLIPKQQIPETPTKTSTPQVFSVDQIDGIEQVFEAISKMKSESSDGPSIHAAILPHHTLVGEPLAEFWQTIADRSDPSVIVVIGPAHENQGSAPVQTTNGVWQTPFGGVATDDRMVKQLVRSGAVADDPMSFENEHSIGVQIPYIAALFPDVPIIPVIAQSTAGETSARKLVDALQDLLPEDALLISSVDFSHYLPTAESDKRDAQTLAAMTARDFDRVDTFGTEYLDSPFAVDAYFLWSDAFRWQQEMVWHENSGRITGRLDDPGTSYFVYFAHDPLPEKPIVLAAAGDMMLGRGVESALKRTSIEHAFGGAAEAFEGSDIAFANLESVLTDVAMDTGKEIFFKGAPERVDVLQLFGLTHVSVANNHVDDYGRVGWEDSVTNVQAAGIQTIGGYSNNGETVFTDIQEKTVAFLAYDDTIRRIDLEALRTAVLDASERSDVVIVSFHWGLEYLHDPSSRQIEVAHTAVDAGADLVIGHHPHVLQGIERYGNAVILYSLGNFIFDQFGTDQNESLVARITFSEKTAVELVPMRISGTFPRLATAAEATETIDRIRLWSESFGTIIDERGIIEPTH